MSLCSDLSIGSTRPSASTTSSPSTKRPHHAVAQHVIAAGIGGDIAADGAAAFRTQAQGKQQTFGSGRFLCLFESDAGFGGQRHAVRVDGADAVHARQAQQHFAVERNLSADQTGIAALGHDGGAGLVADGEDCGDFLGGRGLEQQRAVAVVFAAPFFQMRRDLLRIFAEAFAARSGLSVGCKCSLMSCPWRSCAAQAVIDRFAQSDFGNGHDRDALGAFVQLAQHGEQIGGGFLQIAARAEIQRRVLATARSPATLRPRSCSRAFSRNAARGA